MPRSSRRRSSATHEEKQALRDGRIPEDWKNKPAKLAQKDCDARWTIKYTKAKPKEDGVPQIDLAIPAFGYRTTSRSTVRMG
jgi:IS5 family transposase